MSISEDPLSYPPKPGDPEALLQQGNQLYDSGDIAKALSCYMQARAHGFSSPLLDLRQGVSLCRLDNFSEALVYLKQSVANFPDSDAAWYYLGVVYHNLGDLEKAEVHYQKVIGMCPGHVEAYFFLGQLKESMGCAEEAVFYYQKALAYYPALYQARFNLGRMYLNLGRLSAAEECLKAVIAQEPHCNDPYIALRGIYYQQKKFQQAVETFSQSVSKAPTSHAALFNLGLSHYMGGERKKGLVAFQQAINLEGGHFNRVRIETASACNLRCRHCPTGVSYDKIPRTIMTMDVFEIILSQLRQLHNLKECVMYLGGEPLLNKNIFTMCRRIKAETSVTHLIFNTNAMLLTKEMCQDLANCGLDILEVSIDGRTPEENNSIRRGSDFEAVAKNLHMLEPYLKDTKIYIANVVLRRHDDPITPEPSEYLKKEFPNFEISTIYARKWPGLETAKSLFSETLPLFTPPELYCSKPFTEITVRANGDTVLCCYDLLSECVTGNVKQIPLLDIWKSAEHNDLRKNIIENKVELLPGVCRKCVIYTGEGSISVSETVTNATC